MGWAAVSDKIGRRNTFLIFTAGTVPLYLSLPALVDSMVTTGAVWPVHAFCISSAVAVSMFGGVFAILPAYEADLFGTKFVGPIHGRMLLYSAVAAIIGTYVWRATCGY